MTKHIDGFYNKYKRDLPTDECQLLCSHLDLIFVGRSWLLMICMLNLFIKVKNKKTYHKHQ
jgi:hypothetical protein